MCFGGRGHRTTLDARELMHFAQHAAFAQPDLGLTDTFDTRLAQFLSLRIKTGTYHQIRASIAHNDRHGTRLNTQEFLTRCSASIPRLGRRHSGVTQTLRIDPAEREK